MMPRNISRLELAEACASGDSHVRWSGGYAAYGGEGASQSATIYFSIKPGDRLGRHVDSTEETQFILSGTGELHLDAETRRVAAGDVVVLAEGTPHDLSATSDAIEPLQVVAFFAAPAVTQYFDDIMLPANSHTLGSPHRV